MLCCYTGTHFGQAAIDTDDKFNIRRRSSAHSAYWMSNALVPAGLIMLYKYGWSLEGVLGVLFIIIGAIGYGIYKQKMSVPLIRHDGTNLIYSPSASKPCTIKMDSYALFTVHELGLTAEVVGTAQSRFEVSRLDFDSNKDWDMFIQLLEREPVRLVQNDQ